MKKMLILAGVLALTMSTQCFAEQAANQAVQPPQKQVCNCPPQRMHRPDHKPPFDKAKFEKRLKLTDTQKEQARLIREKGHQAMKPIMDKMRDTRAEMNAVRLSKLAPQAQEEKLGQLRKELRELKKQAHELRMKNMKEFESILTKKQLKELQKMKNEGRKAFEKNHKRQMLKPAPVSPCPEYGIEPPRPLPPVEK